MTVQFSADLIESFSGTFLSPLYDEAKPTPEMHREGWRLYCSPAKLAAIAAPREHAKSTAFTHDYILAALLFRQDEYAVLVSSNEEMAIEHLGDIATVLRENEDVIRHFHIKRFLVDAKTDIIIECEDGHQFRLIARGSGQKMRGRKWRGKRPGLILCDDLEDDEQVESAERRTKFRRWFFRALKPALRDGGKLRIHGTILHEDSLLSRLMSDKTWKTLFYRAHAGFDDFSDILWPEKFPESRLREIRQSFIEQQDASGYSQEYLNDPFDNNEAYIRKDDMLSMKADDHDLPMKIVAGCDFAVSKREKSDRTSFTVVGRGIDRNTYFRDQYVGRWDTVEWIDVLFDIQEKWSPDVFFVEDGVIWKSIAPMLYKEMQARDIWLNCYPILPVKDKATRGRAYQKRSRAGTCRYPKEAEWYPGFELEVLRFTGRGDAIRDDQFDSSAIALRGLDLLADMEEGDQYAEEIEENLEDSSLSFSGMSPITGY
ncbi:MAG: hypothetical protein KGL39_09965 [Patescibacteria group bacterium]|nr:hypothetical protein [Patescibacteria group bacterium]